MSDLHHAESIAEHNDQSLKTLVRAIELAGGQFSLILVRCNYTPLRERVTRALQEFCTLELTPPLLRIGELVLPERATTLYGAIQAALAGEQPQALMVFGLESATHLEQVLTSTNQSSAFQMKV